MSLIARDPDDTPADLLARLADMTDGLPFEETDDNAELIARAIRLAHDGRGAVDLIREARALLAETGISAPDDWEQRAGDWMARSDSFGGQ